MSRTPKNYDDQLVVLEDHLIPGWSINVSLRRAGISQLQYLALLKEDERLQALVARYRKRTTTKNGVTYERIMHASELLPPEPEPTLVESSELVLPRGRHG